MIVQSKLFNVTEEVYKGLNYELRSEDHWTSKGSTVNKLQWSTFHSNFEYAQIFSFSSWNSKCKIFLLGLLDKSKALIITQRKKMTLTLWWLQPVATHHLQTVKQRLDGGRCPLYKFDLCNWTLSLFVLQFSLLFALLLNLFCLMITVEHVINPSLYWVKCKNHVTIICVSQAIHNVQKLMIITVSHPFSSYLPQTWQTSTAKHQLWKERSKI